MKLLIQPDDGIAALLSAIRGAKKSIEIVIFRLDKKEIENELKAAISRGVAVKALVAYTSRDGERTLRKLELSLLEGGVTVARTADDLVRYHDKLMIVDRRTLYLLAFNYTTLDIDYSRSFGVMTEDPPIVEEAIRLFEADCTRQPFVPALDQFVVSPLNARRQLTAFLKGAEKQLLIYDNQLSDREMINILKERANAGVEIKVIGKLAKIGASLEVQSLDGLRLHTRTIIRDGQQAFIGSQSLRKAELDSRREVGLIIDDLKIVRKLLTTFESDWTSNEAMNSRAQTTNLIAAAKAAKKAVKTLVNDLPALVPAVQEAVTGAVAETMRTTPEQNGVEGMLKGAVMEAVREAVQDVIKETVTEVVQGMAFTGQPDYLSASN